MDVLVLIDKLDDLVHNAKAVPLTDQVRIDREEIYEILDQMRATIPEEIKQARWIVKERQEMLAEAKRESDRLLGEAREQAVREASQTEIVKLAERQAQEIIDDARRQARETRLEMEDWADAILSTLEVNLDKFLTAVKRGRERLHERSQETVVAGVAAGVARAPTTTSPTSAHGHPAGRLEQARRAALRRPAGAGGRLAAHPRRRPSERQLGQPSTVALRLVESEEARSRVAETVFAGATCAPARFAVASRPRAKSARRRPRYPEHDARGLERRRRLMP